MNVFLRHGCCSQCCLLTIDLGMDVAVVIWVKRAFTWGPSPPLAREPTRFDFILLPLLDAKHWIVTHPKTTMTVIAFLLSTVVDRMPYFNEMHGEFCRCIDDESCMFHVVLKQFKYVILCV